MKVAAASSVPIALFLLLAVLNDLDVLSGVPSGRARETWASSLLCLVLLLTGVQLVSVLLAFEHRVEESKGSRQQRDKQLRRVRRLRVAVVGAVLAAIVVAVLLFLDKGAGWREAWVAGLAIGAVSGLVTWLVWASLPEKATDDEGTGAEPAPEGGDTGSFSQLDRRRLRAVGASGGGIRAAAFALGGHQALQDCAEPLGISEPEDEPHLFAVSGGGYIAAALALRRTYELDGSKRAHTVPFKRPAVPGGTPGHNPYEMGSPELERLRRHTRYLFEPKAETRDGLVSLVMGAVVNLMIVGLLLRLVAWFSVQIAVSTGFVKVGGSAKSVAYLDLGHDWPVWQWWLVIVGLPFGCLVGVVWTTVRGWSSTSKFDAPDLEEDPDKDSPQQDAMRRLATAARARGLLISVALGWLLLVPGLSVAATGLSSLALANQPTVLGAAVLHAGGFGSDTMCESAFVEAVDDAVRRADRLAAISPGSDQGVEAGACGREVTVTRTSDSSLDGLTVEEQAAVKEIAQELAADGGWPWQTTGVGAILALAAALLRRGPTSDAVVTEGRFVKLRRVLLTWLPLLSMGLLAAYLLLRWTFGLLTAMDGAGLLLSVVLTVLAFLAAFLVDANATSLHSFYRTRLGSAFAVGVDDATRVADELPPRKVYRFSELEDGPRLHVVTTLNTQHPNQAPTMRGGFPLVFSGDGVDIHREGGRRVHVDARTYEQFAGPGRVSILAAVATSGAAISPLMGRYGSVMAPYRVLLTLFNLRVGAWVRNPLHALDGVLPPEKPRFLWMTHKPGLAQVALEGFGASSADRRWVYLSDGGHLDNTSLVECVRHCVLVKQAGRILVLDASNDPIETWSAVGDAIAVVRADLNIELRRVWSDDSPPWMRRYKGGDLDVLVVKAVRTGPPQEARAERNWWQVLPANVQSFQLVNADFPRSSTTRQRFGDLEFEAYRGLGYASTRAALLAARWIPEAD